MKYKIEKNIDINDYPPRGGSVSQYPFQKMEVGDSFICGEYSKNICQEYLITLREILV